MNVTRLRQEERLMKIGALRASISKAEDPDIEKLIMYACSEWGISERTAREYIRIAQFKIKLDKGEAEKLIEDGRKERVSGEQKLQEGPEKRV